MSQKRIAVFPGSFDPLTKGHQAVVRKALPLFDEIIITETNIRKSMDAKILAKQLNKKNIFLVLLDDKYHNYIMYYLDQK